MSNDKMRAEFEAWAESIGRDINRYDDGEYGEIDTNADWFCWQASRAAIVVELPEAQDFDGYYNPGHGFQKGDVVAAIEAAGLKVKP